MILRGKIFLLLSLIFTVLTAGLNVLAENSGNSDESILRAKSDLERHLRQKVRENLRPVFGEDNVVVNVEIVLSEKRKKTKRLKKFLLRKPTTKEDKAAMFPLTKLGVWFRPDAFEEPEVLERNFHERVQSINASATVDESFSDQEAELKSIIEKSVKTAGKYPVNIETEFLKFHRPGKTWSDWILEFKLPFGIVLATLVLMLLLIRLSSKYQDIETKKIAAMETAAANSSRSGPDSGGAEKNLGSEKEAQKMASSAQPSFTGSVESLQSIRLIRSMIQRDKEGVVNLIKQWMSLNSDLSRESLAFIPKYVSMEELVSVLDSMTEDERRLWKKMINNPVKAGFEVRADEFIQSQVMSDLIEPPPPMDQSVRQLLSGITPEECVQCSEQDPEIGAIFANTLSTFQVAKMFVLMSEETSERVIEAGVKFEYSMVPEKSKKLREMLEQLRKGKEVTINPLVERSLELIREVGPKREQPFFDAIAKTGSAILLEKAAHEFFPAELVPQLPRRVLADALKSLSVTFRGELILSVEKEFADILLSALGKEGSKIRELMDSEIEQIREDKPRLKQIRKNKDEIWTTFVGICRETLNSDPSYRELSESVLQGWIFSKTSGEAVSA